MNALTFPTFTAGMVLSLSLIMAIGPQNAHVLRMGLQRQHLALTVAVCAVADIVLIGLGVLGLAQLGGLSDKLQGALIGAGVLFLLVYGWQAFQRFRRPVGPLPVAREAVPADAGPDNSGARKGVHNAPTPSATNAASAPLSRRQAVLSSLAFSWLNPHAWLDTAVLIGTASLAYGQGSTVFGLGAAAGSLVWFVLLGGVAFWLGCRLNSLRVWRALDAMVAVMMWGTAAVLLASLF